MFHVTGTIDSIPYRVGVHDEPVEGEPAGCVMGSTHAVAFLELRVGQTVKATPTSDEVTLSLDDPASVYAALAQHTVINSVEGNAPAIDNASGAIY